MKPLAMCRALRINGDAGNQRELLPAVQQRAGLLVQVEICAALMSLLP